MRLALPFVVGVAAIVLPELRVNAAPASAVRTVPAVELPRYMGDWFEIARYPNRFQAQCEGDVRVTYGLRPDGRVDVTNRCRRSDDTMAVAQGVARVVEGSGGAKLKVRFAPQWLSWLPAVWGDYWVLGLDPAYRWAVVGDPGRDYLWILARTTFLDDATLAEAEAAARAQGYDLSRLQRTAHASR